MKTRLFLWRDRVRSWPLVPTIHKVAAMAWLMDLLSCLYLREWFNHQGLADKALRMALATGTTLGNDHGLMLEEFQGLAQTAFAGILFALIITNTIFYLGYALRQRFAISYVTGYLISAALFSFLMLFEGFPVGGAWELVNILGIPAYTALGFMAWARRAELPSRKTKSLPG